MGSVIVQIDRVPDLAIGSARTTDMWAASAAELEQLREPCAGTFGGGKVLEAMRLIALQLPLDLHWLRDEYLRRYGHVKGAHVGSWDHADAFGRPWPSRTRLATERRRLRLKSIIHASVWRLVRENPHISITRSLFDQVGEAREVGLSGAAVEKLYYAAVHDGMLSIAQWREADRARARAIHADAAKAKDDKRVA